MEQRGECVQEKTGRRGEHVQEKTERRGERAQEKTERRGERILEKTERRGERVQEGGGIQSPAAVVPSSNLRRTCPRDVDSISPPHFWRSVAIPARRSRERRGEHVQEKTEWRGEHAQEKTEQRGERVQEKTERSGESVQEKMEQRGERAQEKMDRRGERVQEKTERRGERVRGGGGIKSRAAVVPSSDLRRTCPREADSISPPRFWRSVAIPGACEWPDRGREDGKRNRKRGWREGAVP
ncbi:hypothetical protein NDU88_004220 [Pleurodeles waltl]|uniref:Uncharacterized protein n=1 Tax=Pleurodeles waltl TaxID=8319 RepID=A0AAV7M703_PLEWA|nr:hypothetical protein NDU88_004220 [Pleurodeles waltl]